MRPVLQTNRFSFALEFGIGLWLARPPSLAARLAPRLAKTGRLLALLKHPALNQIIPLYIEIREKDGGELTPFSSGCPDDSSQLVRIVGQPPSPIPACHQQEKIAPVLIPRQMHRLSQIVGDVERHPCVGLTCHGQPPQCGSVPPPDRPSRPSSSRSLRGHRPTSPPEQPAPAHRRSSRGAPPPAFA